MATTDRWWVCEWCGEVPALRIKDGVASRWCRTCKRTPEHLIEKFRCAVCGEWPRFMGGYFKWHCDGCKMLPSSQRFVDAMREMENFEL
jgi:hypothetical protein